MKSLSRHPRLFLWITDPHLDHLTLDQRTEWFKRIREHSATTLLLTGDVDEASGAETWMKSLNESGKRTYFVLGNHDYYGDGIPTVRERMYRIKHHVPSVCYCPAHGSIRLDDSLHLVGVDGWSDGRAGNFLGSEIKLNDYRQIRQLTNLARKVLLDRLIELGKEEAVQLRNGLTSAINEGAREILVLTHVPPFAESCWYFGNNAINEWTPHFTCISTGEVLREFGLQHPQVHFTVLCGHTHHFGQYDCLPNLTVYTGSAEYGQISGWRTLDLRAASHSFVAPCA